MKNTQVTRNTLNAANTIKSVVFIMVEGRLFSSFLDSSLLFPS